MIDCVMHYTVYTVYGIAYGRRNACFYAAASVTAYVDYECVLFHAFQVASIDDVILAGDIPKYSIDYDIIISELFTKSPSVRLSYILTSAPSMVSILSAPCAVFPRPSIAAFMLYGISP